MNSEFTIAVHALVYLNHRNITISSEALAENVCTNPARIRKVMAKLKKAALVTTKEGTDGGYLFELPAESVTLRQVAEAVETKLISATWRSGSIEMKCLVASGMSDIMDGIYSDLETLCREHLDSITIADIEHEIFDKKQKLKVSTLAE